MRRSLLLVGLTLPLVEFVFPFKVFSSHLSVHKELAALENSAQGRLGVALIDTAVNNELHYNGDKRFLFCSTFKIILAAAILKKSMTQHELLQKHVAYGEADVLSYAPVTKKNISQGMSVAELCSAALQYSDNTAANLLIKETGGITAVNAFARSLGDNVFRLDRMEPDLNSALPSDLRDTTTPKAMAVTMKKILFGDVLAAPQREQLAEWLRGNTTGNDRIRAGVPAGWMVGDKTGTGGDYGTTNDVAVLWPPERAPLILVIYFTQHKKDTKARSDVVASATRMVLAGA